MTLTAGQEVAILSKEVANARERCATGLYIRITRGRRSKPGTRIRVLPDVLDLKTSTTTQAVWGIVHSTHPTEGSCTVRIETYRVLRWLDFVLNNQTRQPEIGLKP